MSAMPAGTPPLPDLNAETYPYAEVQRLLDQVTYFNLYATPDPDYARKNSLVTDDRNGASGSHGEHGLVIGLFLRPFNTVATRGDSLRVNQTIGATAGRYRSRWLFTPPGFAWSPGNRPPATAFDRSRTQDFVMFGDRMTFGESERHGFFGYGMGRTFAEVVGGEAQLWAGAIGNITRGFGKFENLEGVYVFNGMITSDLGFQGNLTLRILDPTGSLRGEDLSARPDASRDVKPDATYIVMSGRKPKTRPKTEYGPPTGKPNLVTIVTPAQMSSVQTYLTDQGAGGLRSEVEIGEPVLNLDASITLDLFAPLGTASSPGAFTTHNLYRLVDDSGRELGTITAENELGRSFGLSFPSAPGQRGLRYGGVGRITQGTGVFEGAQGTISVNSAIGIAPHVLSVMQILRIVNPRPGQEGFNEQAGASNRVTPQPGSPSGGQQGRPAAGVTGGVVRERDLVLRTGERMHYRESGTPGGPVILMLHGNPGYSIAWAPILERLADLGHCVAPDLMGFGDSEKTRIIPSYYNHAEYLDQFVEGLGLRNLVLFIQDWGGALGLDHAVRHQQNIRGIAFFEAILKPYESWETFPQKLDPEKLQRGDPQQSKSALARQKFQDFRADGEIGGRGWQEIAEGNIFISIFMGPLLGHPFDPREIPDPRQDPVLGPLLAPYFRPFPTVWSRNPIWRLAREIPIGGDPPDVVASVSRYSRVLTQWDVPKLLIYSDKGPTLKQEHADWVRQNWSRNLTVRNLDEIPGVQVVEGTHFLQQTHPDVMSRLFREWFVNLR